jgi:hypothetical protein
MAGIMISQGDFERSYGKALKYLNDLAAAGGNKFKVGSGNKVVQPYTVRTSSVINASSNAYTLGITVNSPSSDGSVGQYPQIRLQQTDLFIVTHIGYYITVNVTQTGNTDYANILMTYPQAQFFGMGGAGGFNANKAVGFWQGRLNLTVNSRQILRDWDLWKHCENPQAQYPYFGSLPATTPINYDNERYGSTSGLFPVMPMIPMDGSTDIVLNLNYDTSLASIFGTSTPTITATVRLFGFLAQNMGKINNPELPMPE